MRWIASGSRITEPTRRRALSEPDGSWKIICRCWRIGPELGVIGPGDVLALEHDGALGHVDQTSGAAGQGGLATTGLAHEADRFPPAQLERDAIHGVHEPAAVGRAAGRVVLHHALQPEDGLAGTSVVGEVSHFPPARAGNGRA